MAITEATNPQKSPPLVAQIAVLLALTGAAIGAGWLTGQHLNSSRGAPAPAPAAVEGDIKEHSAPTPLGSVVPLQPIMTNLGGSGEVWVRMELALAFDGSGDSGLAELVHQDILAYMRTVTVKQVEGPSGFQHLKSDLEERARIRTDGRVRQILIRTLLFE